MASDEVYTPTPIHPSTQHDNYTHHHYDIETPLNDIASYARAMRQYTKSQMENAARAVRRRSARTDSDVDVPLDSMTNAAEADSLPRS